MHRLYENDLYYCEHLRLTRKVNEELDEFLISKHPEGKGVMDYLQVQAVHDEAEELMKTYLVRDVVTDELAAYFSVRAGSVKIEFVADEKTGIYPGVELAYFGVNENYIEKHPENKGMGIQIFEKMIIPIAQGMRSFVAAKGIFGYAVNGTTLMERYINSYGFNRLSPENEKKLHENYRPGTDEECIFIYKDIEEKGETGSSIKPR